MHKLRDTSGDSEADLKARLGKIAGKRKIFILGLGNTDRADDGAGVLLAEAMKRLFPSCSYSELDGVEGTVLDIADKDGHAAVFFVDASDMGLDPGSVQIVRKENIKETEISTHRVAVALMASILDKADKEAVVICIQPATIDFRGEVSPQVKKTIEMLSRILTDLMESR